MTREEAEDNYRIKWEKQIKKDMADNSALRARQRPMKNVGKSKEGGAKGGSVSAYTRKNKL
jgi:hypothetical protein